MPTRKLRECASKAGQAPQPRSEHLQPAMDDDALRTVASATTNKAAFVRIVRMLIADVAGAEGPPSKIAAFRALVLFMVWTPFDWTVHRRFVVTVAAKVREFAGAKACAVLRTTTRSIWELIDLFDRRIGIRAACAATIRSGGRCSRRVGAAPGNRHLRTLLGHLCSQHGRKGHRRLVSIVVALESRVGCRDVLVTLAEAVVRRSDVRATFTSLPKVPLDAA